MGYFRSVGVSNSTHQGQAKISNSLIKVTSRSLKYSVVLEFENRGAIILEKLQEERLFFQNVTVIQVSCFHYYICMLFHTPIYKLACLLFDSNLYIFRYALIVDI